MKTVTRIFIVAVVTVVLFAGVQAVKAAGSEAKDVTLQGEVIDMYCFMNHPDTGQGADHAKCAKTCINKGLPIGFLTADGTVYVIIGKDHESAAGMVADFAGKQSVLKGKLVEHNGVKAIEIASISDVK